MLLDFIKSITVGDIALTLAFVVGVIGSVATLHKLYVKHKQAVREREQAEIQKLVQAAVTEAIKPLQTQLAVTQAKVDHMQGDLTQNNLQTARIDLNTAIEHAPHEHESILKLADRYFLELGGDAWMSGKFRKWAKDEGVDINYIADQIPHLKG